MHDRPAEQPNLKGTNQLSRLLSAITLRCAQQPVLTLAIAASLTVLAIGLAWSRLTFHTSRLDLLSPRAGYNQRWLTFLDRFGRDDDAVLLVSHSDPNQVASALTALGNRLQRDPELTGVLFRQSLGQVAHKALYMLPTDQLHSLSQLLQNCSGLVNPTSIPIQAAYATNALALDLAAQQAFSNALHQAQSGLDQLVESLPEEGPLLVEDDGKLGLCLVRLPHVDDQPDRAIRLIQRLEAHLQVMRGHCPEVQFSMTGMPVLEWDEGRSSQRDTQRATFLSLLGVGLIFALGFGSWRMPCAAIVCLAIGLLWTIGLATLFIGHLNLFSVAFGAIIAGLGIDYAIHLLSRLNHLSNRNYPLKDLPLTLAAAMNHCGKGICTGAITTAAAFLVAVLTPFKGMTELGVICALGTISCMVVTVTVLPALLVMQEYHWPRRPASSLSRLQNFHQRLDRFLDWTSASTIRMRIPVLLCTALVSLNAIRLLPQLRYDHNLLNLQADDAPSVRAEHELISRSQHSAWFAVSMARSSADARTLHDKLTQLESVARVEEIGSVLASGNDPQTIQLVAACRQQADHLSRWLAHSHSAALANHLPMEHGQPPNPDSDFIIRPINFQPSTSLDESRIDPHLASQLERLTQSISSTSQLAPPHLSDFPEEVQQRMSSLDGQTFLLRIFAKDNLWDRDNLKQFVQELEAVDPYVTGHPIQTWYASAELQRSYYQAGIYAMLIVAALLMIDLQSIRLVLLALIPVVFSAIQLAGWLVMLDIPLNAANMIVLPLIIGIGIDDGVHMVHDFTKRGRQIFKPSRSTVWAILLTSLTTMVGFGCMALADHRGLQSLGVVLIIGVGLCLMHSWFTLPAVLSLLGPATTTTYPAIQSTPQPLTNLSTQPALTNVPVILSIPDYH